MHLVHRYASVSTQKTAKLLKKCFQSVSVIKKTRRVAYLRPWAFVDRLKLHSVRNWPLTRHVTTLACHQPPLYPLIPSKPPSIPYSCLQAFISVRYEFAYGQIVINSIILACLVTSTIICLIINLGWRDIIT